MSSPGSPDDPAVDDRPDDPDLRAARRTLVLFVVALGAAAAGFVLVLSGNRGDDGGSTIADAGVESSGSDVATAEIGPERGSSVDRYLDERQQALTEVEGERAAVVSLTGYSTVETVDDLLADVELDRYLVALVGDEPRATRDIENTIADVRAEAEEQLAEIEKIAPTVEDDPDYSQFYAEEIGRYRALLDAADRDDVVFGIVVVGRAADLRALGSRASVRLVDVGSSDSLARDAAVRGLRPEETATVGEPPVRP